eukprot:541459-Lingulodinium_polyedra.AAC.1
MPSLPVLKKVCTVCNTGQDVGETKVGKDLEQHGVRKMVGIQLPPPKETVASVAHEHGPAPEAAI